MSSLGVRAHMLIYIVLGILHLLWEKYQIEKDIFSSTDSSYSNTFYFSLSYTPHNALLFFCFNYFLLQMSDCTSSKQKVTIFVQTSKRNFFISSEKEGESSVFWRSQIKIIILSSFFPNQFIHIGELIIIKPNNNCPSKSVT